MNTFGKLLTYIVIPFLMVIVLLSKVYRVDISQAISTPYQDEINLISNIKPSIIFIGNSLVEEAIDETKLQKEISLPVYKLWRNAAPCVMWYIFFKHIILNAEEKPKNAVILFTEHYLPTDISFGNYDYKYAMETLKYTNDRLVYQLSLKDNLTYRFNTKFSAEIKNRKRYKRNIEKYFLRNVFEFFLKKEISYNRIYANVFSFKNKISIADNKNITKTESLDKQTDNFYASLDNSYLPHLIKLSKGANIKLVFIKLKTRTDLNHKTNPMLKKYFIDLKAYLNKNNVILLKGEIDAIISKGKIKYNKTGNAGMTKAGTGDVLAGLCVGFLAQSKDLFQSAVNAAYFNGLIGDILLKKKKGFTYLASDMVEEIKKLKKYLTKQPKQP